MNADGSNRRPIVGGAGQSAYIQSLRWSPRGDRLAYTLRSWNGSTSAITTRVVDLAGGLLAEFPGLAEARWSPGSGRFAAIRVDREGDMGGYYGTPVVVDLETGAEIAIGPLTSMYVSPAWSPDGGSVALVCISNYVGQPDGSFALDPAGSCNGDGLRIAAADGSGSRVVFTMNPTTGPYFSNPSWSPAGNSIALWSQGLEGSSQCRGYVFVDVASGATSGCAPLPPLPVFIGGRCGGSSDMGASTWTADGRLVFAAQGAGQSGVFVDNPATGPQSVIPNMNAGPVSLGPAGNQLAFAGGQYIWAAGKDGANLTLLAEGHSPAWQPIP